MNSATLIHSQKIPYQQALMQTKSMRNNFDKEENNLTTSKNDDNHIHKEEENSNDLHQEIKPENDSDNIQTSDITENNTHETNHEYKTDIKQINSIRYPPGRPTKTNKSDKQVFSLPLGWKKVR